RGRSRRCPPASGLRRRCRGECASEDRSSGSDYNVGQNSRTMKPVHDATCAVACSAEIIGSKWTALLVHDLSEGARRFSELEHSCPGISPRTLSERLRWLGEEGVVDRRSYAETPPRVEYQLTPKGLALLPVIEAMRQFGHDWLPPHPEHTPDALPPHAA